jgi:hypothetical protein
MITLVFFLEEPSAREMLIGVLPKILPDHIVPRFVVFEGKQDLEKQLVRKLKHWRSPNSKFFVLRDQDSGDCRLIKRNLLEKCSEADKPDTIVRIACHELESFYLGDLQAVEKGLKISRLSKLQNNRKYREPDKVTNPAQELMNLTKNYYQKVSGSRAIGKYLSLENNLSHSFNVLVKAIKDVSEK